MKLTKFAIPMALVLALAACAPGQGKKQTGGTLLGAGLGALTGSQIGGGRGKLAAVAIGALAGAYLGNEVGKSLDKRRPYRLCRTQPRRTDARVSTRPDATSSWVQPGQRVTFGQHHPHRGPTRAPAAE